MLSHIVYLDGIIGAGKSTFGRRVARLFPNVEFREEPVAAWENYAGSNLLQEFYADPTERAFEFQLAVMASQNNVAKLPMSKYYTIIERPLVSSVCFQKLMQFSPVQQQLLEDYHAIIKEHQLAPSFAIYLPIAIPMASERIKARARIGEEEIAVDYLSALKFQQEKLFGELEEQMPVYYCDYDLIQTDNSVHNLWTSIVKAHK